MINIIWHGKYAAPTYVVDCRYCGCRFSFNGFDTKHPKENIGCKQTSESRWVICPECGADNAVATAKEL